MKSQESVVILQAVPEVMYAFLFSFFVHFFMLCNNCGVFSVQRIILCEGAFRSFIHSFSWLVGRSVDR